MATLDELSDAEILALIGSETADDLTADLTERAAGVTAYNEDTAPRLWAALEELREKIAIFGPSPVYTTFRQALSDVALGLSAILRLVDGEDTDIERYGDLKRLLNTAASDDPDRYADLNSALGTEADAQ